MPHLILSSDYTTSGSQRAHEQMCYSRYFVDCRNLVGKAPAFDFFRPSSDTHCSAGEAAWAKMYPSLPFHVNFDSVKGAVADMLESLSSVLGLTPAEANPQQILPALPTSCLTYDLEAAVQRQKSFYYQVSLPHYRDAQFIENAIDRCSLYTHRAGACACCTHNT